MIDLLLIAEKFALSLYHCGDFTVGVVLATLVCWWRWRRPSRSHHPAP